MTATGARCVCLIPARGGSTRVPRKNLVPLAGQPLIAHSIRHALSAPSVDEVFVSTDDEEIARVSREHGAEVIDRPASISGPYASTETAIVHALDHLAETGRGEPEVMVVLQCTSPIRRHDDVEHAVSILKDEGADSLFSACRSYHFIWRDTDRGYLPFNYDYMNRPRSQDMGEQWHETGSIFVFRPWVIRKLGNRLGGKITVYPMDYWSSFEIDRAEDVELLQWLMSRPEYAPTPKLPDRIDLVAFDFDEVMTDDEIYFDAQGNEFARCSRQDVRCLEDLREAGTRVAVLSTRSSPLVAERCARLSIPCHQGLDDKAAALSRIMEEQGVSAEHAVFFANGRDDMACLGLVGLPIAIGNADPAVKARSRWCLGRPGGRGAIREFFETFVASRSSDA